MLSGTSFIAYNTAICVLMMLSAFFSGAETAIVSSRRVAIETLAKKKERGAERALFILNNLEEAISAVLIGNNIVNVAATAFITYVAATAFMLNDGEIFAVTAVQIIIFLMLCEMTPKLVAKAKAESALILISLPLKWLLILFKPLNFLSVSFSSGIKKLFRLESSSGGIVRSRDELDILFQIGEKDGAIDEEHHEYISGMLSFKELAAQEIMTPIIDISSVELGSSIKSLVQMIVATRYSRIPVYAKRVDNIIGYVFYRDILKNKNVKEIQELLHPAVYVPATKNIFQLFMEMQRDRVSIVFVVNEYGGVTGMVTDEDITEEIVGDIQTLDHGEEDVVKRISDKEYLLDGNVDIDRFCKMFAVDIEKKGFETLAGFFLYELGHIPKKGESFSYGRYSFAAEEVTDRGIKKISLKSKRKIKARS